MDCRPCLLLVLVLVLAYEVVQDWNLGVSGGAKWEDCSEVEVEGFVFVFALAVAVAQATSISLTAASQSKP